MYPPYTSFSPMSRDATSRIMIEAPRCDPQDTHFVIATTPWRECFAIWPRKINDEWVWLKSYWMRTSDVVWMHGIYQQNEYTTVLGKLSNAKPDIEVK